jgi:predicted nicotinamide N-methyase
MVATGAWSRQRPISKSTSTTAAFSNTFQIDNEALTVVSDPQRYLFKGIGGSIWNASIELASFLKGVASTLPASPNVLELGAGCGIPGLHFARTHPRAQVVTTDVPHLLPLLRHNAKGVANVTVAPLTWGLEEDMKPYLPQRLDLIIAADVVFDADFHDAFLDTLRTLSLGTEAAPREPPARIILAVANRQQEVEEFEAATRRHDMELSQLKLCPSANSWASAVGIFDCSFRPLAPRKASRSLSDASTACSSPTSNAAPSPTSNPPVLVESP